MESLYFFLLKALPHQINNFMQLHEIVLYIHVAELLPPRPC